MMPARPILSLTTTGTETPANLKGLTMQDLSELPLTGFDTTQAVAVVWATLERLELQDDEQDQLNTAMAWIEEAL